MLNRVFWHHLRLNSDPLTLQVFDVLHDRRNVDDFGGIPNAVAQGLQVYSNPHGNASALPSMIRADDDGPSYITQDMDSSTASKGSQDIVS